MGLILLLRQSNVISENMMPRLSLTLTKHAPDNVPDNQFTYCVKNLFCSSV